jgi:hypothetical protein
VDYATVRSDILHIHSVSIISPAIPTDVTIPAEDTLCGEQEKEYEREMDREEEEEWIGLQFHDSPLDWLLQRFCRVWRVARCISISG